MRGLGRLSPLSTAVEQKLEVMTEAPAQVHMYLGRDMQARQEHHGAQQEWNNSPMAQGIYSGQSTVQRMQGT